jgi:DtxR family transcriptional regulator, Mn-dependent transcriptional regulator
MSNILIREVDFMSMTALSGTLQDYLKAIYCLEKETGEVSASLLAGALGVSLPSVTSMMRKLAARKLISYTPYLSIALTRAGERQALEVVRHHRLLETYLQKALGFSLDTLHDEADRLEHAISEELEEKIDVFLGRPAFDPHGSPIPDCNGRVAERTLVPLTALGPGEKGTVRQITCRGSDQLRHLESIGLVPGAEVRVKTAQAGSGVLHLVLPARGDEPIGVSIASCVLVSPAGGGA